MKDSFQILNSDKTGLDSRESYVVVRGATSFLRVLGGEPKWELMTATASEDHGPIRVCSDRIRLVEAALRLGAELDTGPSVKRDRAGREYVQICFITRDQGESDESFEGCNEEVLHRFFEIFDECRSLESRDSTEMRELYDALASDNDGGDVYLTDGMWLRSDGSLKDRGR